MRIYIRSFVAAGVFLAGVMSECRLVPENSETHFAARDADNDCLPERAAVTKPRSGEPFGMLAVPGCP